MIGFNENNGYEFDIMTDEKLQRNKSKNHLKESLRLYTLDFELINSIINDISIIEKIIEDMILKWKEDIKCQIPERNYEEKEMELLKDVVIKNFNKIPPVIFKASNIFTYKVEKDYLNLDIISKEFNDITYNFIKSDALSFYNELNGVINDIISKYNRLDYSKENISLVEVKKVINIDIRDVNSDNIDLKLHIRNLIKITLDDITHSVRRSQSIWLK